MSGQRVPLLTLNQDAYRSDLSKIARQRVHNAENRGELSFDAAGMGFYQAAVVVHEAEEGGYWA